MALEHVEPCEVANLYTYGTQDRENASNALVKTEAFEAIIMHLSPDRPMPEHSVDGPITLQCLEGAVDLSLDGDVRSMKAGDWMFLPGGLPHTVEAQSESRLLLTILFTAGG